MTEQGKFGYLRSEHEQPKKNPQTAAERWEASLHRAKKLKDVDAAFEEAQKIPPELRHREFS